MKNMLMLAVVAFAFAGLSAQESEVALGEATETVTTQEVVADSKIDPKKGIGHEGQEGNTEISSSSDRHEITSGDE
jgi:hypothetical protein